MKNVVITLDRLLNSEKTEAIVQAVMVGILLVGFSIALFEMAQLIQAVHFYD